MSSVTTTTPVTTLPSPSTTETPKKWELEIIDTIQHNSSWFTQGLIFDSETNTFFESTGAPGGQTSYLISYSLSDPINPNQRIDVNPRNFANWWLDAEVPDSVFAEGLEKVGDQLYQLTWRKEIALIWQLDSDTGTFQPANVFSYSGEGWGLCYDGTSLYMSNGTGTLSRRDPATFEELEQIVVKRNGVPVAETEDEEIANYRINELECAKGLIWGNLWFEDEIISIDPSNGEITGILDASILEQPRSETTSGAVLNGIAYDADSDSFWLTGKFWNQLYQVKIS